MLFVNKVAVIYIYWYISASGLQGSRNTGP